MLPCCKHAIGHLSFLPGALWVICLWFGLVLMFLYYSLLPVSRFCCHLTHEFPPTHLSYVDLKRICIYTCVQRGHNMSLTTLEVVRQTGSQSILDAFQVYSHLYFYIVNCYLNVISDKKMSRPQIPNGNYFNRYKAIAEYVSFFSNSLLTPTAAMKAERKKMMVTFFRGNVLKAAAQCSTALNDWATSGTAKLLWRYSIVLWKRAFEMH